MACVIIFFGSISSQFQHVPTAPHAPNAMQGPGPGAPVMNVAEQLVQMLQMQQQLLSAIGALKEFITRHVTRVQTEKIDSQYRFWESFT